jgi:hypothetical protein
MAKLTTNKKSDEKSVAVAKSVASPKSDFDVNDFTLSHPNDKVVSKTIEGNKQYSVLPHKVIENLGISKGLIGGVFLQEDDLTKKVLAKIYGKATTKNTDTLKEEEETEEEVPSNEETETED